MQEVQTRNECMLKFFPSESNSSDVLTEGLGKTKTESFAGDLLGTNSSFNSKRQAGVSDSINRVESKVPTSN